MSTAIFPAFTSKGATRRLESLCLQSCVATSAGVTLPALLPSISAESTPGGFTAVVASASRSNFRVECQQSAVSWTGEPNSLSLWIVDSSNRSFRCVDPECDSVRSEALSARDQFVAVSKSISEHVGSIDSIVEMALCDEPSLTTAASWILDAADDADLAGPHVVILWRAL